MSRLILAQIQGPDALRSLGQADLTALAAEIRRLIVLTVSRNGGHLASNLGVVELTIALHRVFHSPDDKIVWDVGHQCYTHKLLTGRYAEFSTLRRENGIAGFPKHAESPHDVFDTGHASTSISAALGLLVGERLKGGKNRVVAVIGDGALTGGMAYEALSHAGQLALPLVVILNDNKMSISPNVGGLSKYLSRLSMKAKYQLFRRTFDALVKDIPYVGAQIYAAILRMKRAVKAVFYTDNFFVDLGFEYVGPIDGHNIPQLEQVLTDVRNLERPVVIHVITRKGKGYRFAENDPGNYHGVGVFSVSGGLSGAAPAVAAENVSRTDVVSGMRNDRIPPTFTAAFSAALEDAARRDSRITAVTAAMEKGTGLTSFKALFPDRFFDTGIAEEHAVTFSAGMAVQGLRPVVAIYSTFIQRAVDQVIHDVCLQGLPVVFALDRAGFVPDDGETHQGLFDISLLRPVPGISILAPACAGEFRLMLNWALTAARPVVIRYPKALCPPEAEIPGGETDGIIRPAVSGVSAPIRPGRGVWLRGGIDGETGGGGLCLAFTGGLYPQVQEAAEFLAKEGVDAHLYNLRFLKPVDEDYLLEIMAYYGTVVFIEEGVRSGGFGEYAAGLALRRKEESPGDCVRVLVLAAGDSFAGQGTREKLLRESGLDGRGIALAVKVFLGGTEDSDAVRIKSVS
ncbi:MAG: 1-deoxy-D-xylulose-5-phosphate synthase [Spirochaetaceae bacterium]|jgi:1-deoxy-D-xylulose-5-phosphate synthase|nr:1-deoxy-D-xylulose-5-phosphate synthase [Spirochaetaceae bacterium]